MRARRWAGHAGALLVFAVAMTSSPSPSSAQQAPAAGKSDESSALVEKARELYREGLAAMSKSQWEKARAAFVAAWRLKEHYTIAGNLGAAEMKLGLYRDAAEHLSYYVRSAPKEKVKELQQAEALLAEARGRVGALAITAEPPGAEVLIDGVVIGKTPLDREVFVETGARTVEVRREGYVTQTRRVNAAAGQAAQAVTVTLAKVGDGSARGERDEDGGGASMAVIGVGIGAAALAVVGGIVFTAVSNGHAADAEEQRALFVREGVANPCLMPALASRCAEFKSSLSAQGTTSNLAVWSFVLGGALGAGTAIYALTAPKPKSTTAVRAVPVATTRGGGLVITGRW